MTGLITVPQRTPAVVEPEDPGLADLKRLHARLGGLLSDPQPGLFTWRQMLGNTLIEMADYAGYGMVSEMVRRK